MHWVPVLNHFDAFFEAPARRGEETLSSVSPLGGRSAEPARWIVRASCVLPENCANKHVYGSCEHLGALLSCDDARGRWTRCACWRWPRGRAPGSRGNRSRAGGAAGAAARAVRRPADRAADAAREVRAADETDAEDVTEEVAVRVFDVPSGAALGGGGAAARAPRRGGATAGTAGRRRASLRPVWPRVSRGFDLGKVHFAFYCPGGEDELLGDLGPAGRRAVIADRAELAASGESDRALAARLAKAHGVPAGLRFPLFARVRLARLGASADPAEACRATLFRLMAFVVLLRVDRAAAEGGARGVRTSPPKPRWRRSSPRTSPSSSRSCSARSAERAGVPKEVVEASGRALAALAGRPRARGFHPGGDARRRPPATLAALVSRRRGA